MVLIAIGMMMSGMRIARRTTELDLKITVLMLISCSHLVAAGLGV